jgi:hypothetical protein
VNVAELQQRGRLSQTCPGCGLVEAAGAYCTACRRPTGPDTWSADPRHVTRAPDKASQRLAEDATGLGSPTSRSSDPWVPSLGAPDGRLLEAPVPNAGASVQDPDAVPPAASGVWTSTVPTSPAAPGGYALPGSAEDAGPNDLSPGSPGPDVLALGL